MSGNKIPTSPLVIEFLQSCLPFVDSSALEQALSGYGGSVEQVLGSFEQDDETLADTAGNGSQEETASADDDADSPDSSANLQETLDARFVRALDQVLEIFATSVSMSDARQALLDTKRAGAGGGGGGGSGDGGFAGSVTPEHSEWDVDAAVALLLSATTSGSDSSPHDEPVQRQAQQATGARAAGEKGSQKKHRVIVDRGWRRPASASAPTPAPQQSSSSPETDEQPASEWPQLPKNPSQPTLNALTSLSLGTSVALREKPPKGKKKSNNRTGGAAAGSSAPAPERGNVHIFDLEQFDADLSALYEIFPNISLDILGRLLVELKSIDRVFDVLTSEESESESEGEGEGEGGMWAGAGDDSPDAAPFVDTASSPSSIAAASAMPFVSAWSSGRPSSSGKSAISAAPAAPTKSASAETSSPKPVDLSSSVDLSNSFQSAASKLKRLKLKEIHSSIDPVTIDEIFFQNNCNIARTQAAIFDMFPSERARQQELNRERFQPKPARAPEKPVPLAGQSAAAPRPSAAPAALDARQNLRDEYLHQASRSYASANASNNRAAVAGYYAEQAREQSRRLHIAASQHAAETAHATVFAQFKGSLHTWSARLDLHGYTVSEALAAVQHVVVAMHKSARSDDTLLLRRSSGPTLTIIAGRGSHSAGGRAKILPAVRALLASLRYHYSEVQSGVLVVDVVRNYYMDYYSLLNASPKDDTDTIRRSYQRLVLKHHPDKQSAMLAASADAGAGAERAADETVDETAMFRLIQEAWDTLRNPATRAVYDAQRTNAHLSAPAAINDVLAFEDLAYNEEECFYFHPCRCSGMYIVTKEDMKESGSLFGCSDCSLSIQVNFDGKG